MLNLVYSRNSRNVLHVAANYATAKIIKLLLEKVEKTHVLSQDNKGNTPLHYAKNADIAQLLIDAGADVEKRNFRGDTPLLTAKYVDVIEKLLSLGADYKKSNKEKLNVLYTNARDRRDSCVNLIKKSTTLRFLEPEMNFPWKIIYEDAELYPKVKKATVEGLLRQLVYDKYSDDEFTRAFFYTYRDLMTPSELLQKIIGFFDNKIGIDVPKIDDADAINMLDNLNDYKPPPGIVSALCYWIRHFFNDFSENFLSNTLLTFIKREDFVTALYPHNKILEILFSEQMENAASRDPLLRGKSLSDISAAYTNKPEFFLLAHSAKLLAKHLTLIEFNFFKTIKLYKNLSTSPRNVTT